jgi:DNA polymerase-4
MRLRAAQMWAGGITLGLRFTVPENKSARKHYSGIPQQGWGEALRLVECQDTQTLIEGLQKLWAMRPTGEMYQRPFMVSVTLVDLAPDRLHTLDLFAQEDSGQRRTQLTHTMDAINKKYGSQALYFGGMHLARASAPTRIAFSSIPDLF